MKLAGLLVFLIGLIATNATTITLPTTQDFAIVNPGRTKTSITTPDILSLFNNGISSSIAYFGVDLSPLIDAASITSESVLPSVIISAHLVVRNFSIIGSFGSDPITIPFSSLNPGQTFDESTVTLTSTPTVKGQMGTITFSNSGATIMDVTNYIIEALTMPYQGGMFGFQVAPPGGPIMIPSHRSDDDAITIEIEYRTWIHGGTNRPGSSAAPETTSSVPPETETTTTTTTAVTTTTVPPATTTTSTTVPATTSLAPSSSRYCWTCASGYSHWYELGLPESEDPCACIKNPPATTATNEPIPVPPTSAQPSEQDTPTAEPQTPSTIAPERNGSERLSTLFTLTLLATAILLVL